VAHGPVGLEPPIHLAEVDGSLALMNLHRISTAKRDVRPPFSCEVDEIAFTARAAARPGYCSGDLGVLVGPKIEGKESSPQCRCLRSANQQLQRFGNGDRGNKIHRGVEDARAFAGFHHPARRVGEDAGQAGTLAREHIQRDRVAAHCGGVNPGPGMRDRVIVDEIASLEIIGAVEDQIHSLQQSFNVCGDEIVNFGLNYDCGIKGGDFACCGDGLG